MNLRGYPLQQWCSVSFAAGLVNTCMIGEHYLVIRKMLRERCWELFFFLEPKFPQDACGLRLSNTPPTAPQKVMSRGRAKVMVAVGVS